MPAMLSRITIFPIKSLAGVDVESATVLPNGALENDRRFALIDADGDYVNGKRTAAVHHIRAKYDLAEMTVRFNDAVEFSLRDQVLEIGDWLSEAVGVTCRLTENPAGGFPDLTLDETRRRFRANLEVAGVEPFWEDRLVGPTGTAVPFQIGSVHWLGMNPCQRCVVPTRGAESGTSTAGFQKAFAVAREKHLPAWAPRDRFNHFYRLAVNTRPAPSKSIKTLHIGDRVEISSLTGVQSE